MSAVCHRLGKEKFWVHDLFQSCLNAWRVAGLPNPGEEAKSYLSDM
jgi:tRNA 2-thiouridine synthesizing protein E